MPGGPVEVQALVSGLQKELCSKNSVFFSFSVFFRFRFRSIFLDSIGCSLGTSSSEDKLARTPQH